MIRILDNFFDEDQYDKIIYHIKNKIYFTPRFFDGATEKTKDQYYGDRFALKDDKNLHSVFIKQAEKKFNFKIKKVDEDCCIDLRNLDRFIPHTDEGLGKINILIMLDGPVGVTTGTVFYNKSESLELDIHVGFRPNRAVLFPSNHLHSPHKCELKGIRRYTSTLFITEYENLS